jgi:hypothetical protein
MKFEWDNMESLVVRKQCFECAMSGSTKIDLNKILYCSNNDCKIYPGRVLPWQKKAMPKKKAAA